MKVASSADAGRLVAFKGNDATVFDVYEGTEYKIKMSSAPRALLGASDVSISDFQNEAIALKDLRSRGDAIRALHLIDCMLLESSSVDPDIDFLESLGRCLETLLEIETVKSAVLGVIFSYPHPNARSLEAVATQVKSTFVTSLFSQVIQSQQLIRRSRELWDQTVSHCFSDPADASSATVIAQDAGLFWKAASIQSDPKHFSDVVFVGLKALKHVSNSREVVMGWLTRLRGESSKATELRPQNFAYDSGDQEDASSLAEAEDHLRAPRHIPASVAFPRVKKQIDAIVMSLIARDLPRATDFAEKLVASQVADGDEAFAAKTLCNIAMRAKEVGHYSLALDWTIRATDLAPDDSYAHCQAADLYLALYRYGDALKHFALARQFGDAVYAAAGEARVLRKKGALDEALNAYAAALKEFRILDSDAHIRGGHAEVLRELGRFKEALAAYDAYIEESPGLPTLYLGRASTLRDSGATEDACAAYRRACKIFPDEPVAYGGLGTCLRDLQRYPEALDIYRDAVERFPTQVVLLCGLAEVYKVAGRHEEALARFKEIVQVYPEDSSCHSGYAEALREAGRISDAIEVYSAARKKFPAELIVRSGYANILRVSGRLSEALVEYEGVTRDFPFNLDTLVSRGALLREFGQADNAIELYDRVLARDPSNLSARTAKAAILGTRKFFEEAHRILPNDPPKMKADWVAQHVRAMLYLKAGRFDAAVELLKEGASRAHGERQRALFQVGLALAMMRRGQFKDSLHLTSGMRTPFERLLAAHAYGELGLIRDCDFALRSVNDNAPPPILQLKKQISLYTKGKGGPSEEAKGSLLDYELDLLLMAA